MIVSLDQSLLGQKSPWTNVFLGLMSPWTNVYLDNSVLGLLSLGQTVTWTTAPWTNVLTPYLVRILEFFMLPHPNSFIPRLISCKMVWAGLGTICIKIYI